MWKVFFRQLLLILLLVPAALAGMHWIALKMVSEREQDYAQAIYLGPMRMMEANLMAGAHDKANLLSNLQQLQTILGDVQLSLHPLAEFGVEQQHILRQGRVIYRSESGRDRVFYRLQGQEQVLVIHIPPEPQLADAIIAVYLVVVLVMALALYLAQVRPFWRDLQHLRSVADKLGTGDLQARAATLSAASGMGPLAVRINEMADRIEQLVAAQQDLLNAVAHELRTPLARAHFALSMLTIDTEERQQRLYRGLRDDLDEMGHLTSELLGYGRLDARSGPLALESMTADRLVVRASQSRLLRHRVVLELEPLPLKVEPALMVHALGNLLDNADRYARSQLRITIRSAAGEVWIAVEDDGEGIAQADRLRIFEPFVRIDASRNRDTGGAGLGLALVKRITERHGGRVWVEAAAPGTGARFVLALPSAGP